MKKTETLAGYVGVDAGLVMIGDPCYIVSENISHPVHNWDTFCDSLSTNTKMSEPTVKSLNFPLGHEGLGVVISSGYGDGCYPVYVTKKDGRIKEARIVFF